MIWPVLNQFVLVSIFLVATNFVGNYLLDPRRFVVTIVYKTD